MQMTMPTRAFITVINIGQCKSYKVGDICLLDGDISYHSDVQYRLVVSNCSNGTIMQSVDRPHILYTVQSYGEYVELVMVTTDVRKERYFILYCASYLREHRGI